MIALANLLDEMADDGRVLATETPAEIVLAQVDAVSAADVLGRVRALGWRVRVENAAAEEVVDDLNAAFQPFRLTVSKPEIEGRVRLLTLCGFDRWLSGDPVGAVQVARCQRPFETGLFRVGDWTDDGEFEATQRSKSPRALVREMQQNRVVPDDIRPWLARDMAQTDWNDPIFQVWAKHATLACIMALATEVNAGTQISFRGSAQLTIDHPDVGYLPSASRFAFLQKLVEWVYENPSETETRHRLSSFELGRLGRSGNVDVDNVLEYSPIALESAKLAFQYSLAKISSDTSKSLAELRKSLSDETSRLSEMIRQIIAAVSGTVFVGIGLIAARFSTDTPPAALSIMALVLVAYVVFVVYSGHKQIVNQRKMRRIWREKLYGYISDDEYKKMVLDPADETEDQFNLAATWGLSIAGAITVAVYVVVGV